MSKKAKIVGINGTKPPEPPEPPNPPEPPPPSGEPVPVMQRPAVFGDDAAAILRRANISRKQFTRYAEHFTLYMLTHCSADFAISIQRGIRTGDKTAMEMFAKMIGLIKNESGVSLQNNIMVNAGNGHDFDTIVRNLDARDRNGPTLTIDMPKNDILNG